jgi:hypothetical protein
MSDVKIKFQHGVLKMDKDENIVFVGLDSENRNMSKKGSKELNTNACHILSFEVINEILSKNEIKEITFEDIKLANGCLGEDNNLVIKKREDNLFSETGDRTYDNVIRNAIKGDTKKIENKEIFNRVIQQYKIAEQSQLPKVIKEIVLKEIGQIKNKDNETVATTVVEKKEDVKIEECKRRYKPRNMKKSIKYGLKDNKIQRFYTGGQFMDGGEKAKKGGEWAPVKKEKLSSILKLKKEVIEPLEEVTEEKKEEVIEEKKEEVVEEKKEEVVEEKKEEVVEEKKEEEIKPLEEKKEVIEEIHPICEDGSYNMIFKVNKGLNKYDAPTYKKEEVIEEKKEEYRQSIEEIKSSIEETKEEPKDYHPICKDGSYNMIYNENKGLNKYDAPTYEKSYSPPPVETTPTYTPPVETTSYTSNSYSPPQSPVEHRLCNDGSYDMRCPENRGLDKYDSPSYNDDDD